VNLFTSYFAVARKVEAAGLVPVSIALWPPRGWSGRRYPALAPRREMFGRDDYTALYNAMLAQLGAAEVAADLGDRACLLCFEHPRWFCHRRLAAEWLEAALGIEVAEFGVPRADTPAAAYMPSRE
jgi:hypothetical protein